MSNDPEHIEEEGTPRPAPDSARAEEDDALPPGDDGLDDVRKALLREQASQNLERALDSLPPLHRAVVEMISGLDGPELSLRETMAEVGVTHPWVLQLRREAFELILAFYKGAPPFTLPPDDPE